MNVDGNNRLSVYLLRSDNRSEDLDRTVVALSILGGHVEAFQYATVDEGVIDELGLRIVETPGSTVDSLINELHRDIEDLSVELLAALTQRFMPGDTIQPREVGRLIAECVKGSSLPRSALTDEIEERLIAWSLLARESHSEEARKDAQEQLTAAFDEWQEALRSYRSATEADPSEPEQAKLASRLRNAKRAAKNVVGNARRILRAGNVLADRGEV